MQDYIKLAYEAGKQQAQQEASANLEKLSQAAYEQGVAQALEDSGISKEALIRYLRPTTAKQVPSMSRQISDGLAKVKGGTATYSAGDVIRGITSSNPQMNINRVLAKQPELRSQIVKMRPTFPEQYPKYFPTGVV